MRRTFVCAVLVSSWVGCGGGGASHPAVNFDNGPDAAVPGDGDASMAPGQGGDGDAASAPGSDGGAPPGPSGSDAGADAGTPGPVVRTGACTSYTPTSIADMRHPAGGAAPAVGCFELAHVGLVARTDSPTEPRIYLQDKGGADYSAILAKCSATAMHPCSTAVATLIPQLYDTFVDAAQLSVRGWYQYSQTDGFEQFYIEEIIEEGGRVVRPSPITLTVADLTINGSHPAKWFRRATVAVPAQDPLVIYDFSPDDLALANSAACPAFAGFAMMQKSNATALGAATGCSGATSPVARAVDPNEILIGRQFFKQFLYSTDCACAAGTGQILLQPTQTVAGTIVGYLTIEKDKGGVAAYQVFEAAADQTFKFSP